MKIGLIGCGRRGAEHLDGLRRCGEVEIVLADDDPARARALALGEAGATGWVESPVEIFTDPTIAAIDLCVSAAARAPLVRRSLAAAKDFFCQPPLCETAAEALELDELARRNGRIGMVERIHRHAPQFREARAILADADNTGISPVIGKLTAATMRIGDHRAADPHRLCNGAAGDGLNRLLAHLLDLAVWYFGPIEGAELMASEMLGPGSGGAGDFVLARCRTRAGFPIVMQADLLSPCFAETIEVQGEDGAIMASTAAGMPRFVFAANAANGYGAGRTDLDGAAVDLMAAQMAAFVAALRDRAPEQRDRLADCVPVIEALAMLNA